MDFGLSEEQQLLQETIGQFLANENDPSQLRARFDTIRGCRIHEIYPLQDGEADELEGVGGSLGYGN